MEDVTICHGKVSFIGYDINHLKVSFIGYDINHLKMPLFVRRALFLATIINITGLRDWKKAIGSERGTLQIHEDSSAHKNALIKAANFMKIHTGKEKGIKSSIPKVLKNEKFYLISST
jgi:hypothetical protein